MSLPGSDSLAFCVTGIIVLCFLYKIRLVLLLLADIFGGVQIAVRSHFSPGLTEITVAIFQFRLSSGFAVVRHPVEPIVAPEIMIYEIDAEV
jgi:hypothetical protein